MARNRTLKPDFFKDEDLAVLSIETRYFFEGLWCYADKEGRLEDRPKYLKIEIFPYDNVDVDKMLSDLENPNIKDRPKKQFIKRYDVDGKKYIQILEFRKHQSPHHTEKNSAIPSFNGELTVNERMSQGECDHCGESDSESYINNKVKFESFWKAYPKRKNRGQAEKAFYKINPDEELLKRILDAIELARNDPNWIKDNGQYIPYPATWLNAKGWEDEIPELKKKSDW